MHACIQYIWHIDADCEPVGIEQVSQVQMVDLPKMLA